nr:MAG: replication associated protein [Cressdnaviricota sp.]
MGLGSGSEVSNMSGSKSLVTSLPAGRISGGHQGTKLRERPPEYRYWIMTIQNPDPSEDLVKYVYDRVGDVKKVTWSYEQGKEEIGQNNPAWAGNDDREDFKWDRKEQGGNLHWQVFFAPQKRFREIAMRKRMHPHWIEPCYAPRSAENYCAKADSTLVDGPWEFGEIQQGERNDLKTCHTKVMTEGETYTSLLKKGDCLSVLARYPRFVMNMQMMAGDVNTEELWPLEFEGHVMNKPDPALKRRHWWIVGPADWGKTYGMEEALGTRPVFYTKGNNKNKMEGYADQNLIVFDDCFMTFEELEMYTGTHKYGLKIPGRNFDGWLGRGKSRNVIVITNKTIEKCKFSEAHEPAIRARFIEIQLKPKSKWDDKVVAPVFTKRVAAPEPTTQHFVVDWNIPANTEVIGGTTIQLQTNEENADYE